MSARRLEQHQFVLLARLEGGTTAQVNCLGNEPLDGWSLSSHSPGQEPWVLGLEELYRLQREAGNADSLDDQFVLADV